MSGISGLQMDVSSLVRVGGNFIKIFAVGAKSKNLARRSEISVSLVRFSLIAVLKKHARLSSLDSIGNATQRTLPALCKSPKIC